MRDLIRRWLFPDWRPAPEKGWVLIQTNRMLSEFEILDESDCIRPNGHESTRYKLVYVFKNVDTGKVKTEEHWNHD